jgi:hypothetical protein
MKENELQTYFDLERTDIDPEMFAAALALEHITHLIVWGGSRYSRPDEEEVLFPHHLEAFLDRAVAAAQKRRRFEQQWRLLQSFFPSVKVAWEKGQILFQEDLTRIITNEEEMEYFSMIDFVVDSYAIAGARKTYPHDSVHQAWAINGYMMAWRRHFLKD